MDPDDETKKRIENLAIVGKYLAEIGNENTGNTDYFLVKVALENFEKGINNLSLDPDSKEGMKRLIEYLNKKVEKRFQQATA